MDNKIQIKLPIAMDFTGLEIVSRPNITFYLAEADAADVSRVTDPDYEQFLADVWVGIVLTLMVLSCVCCMCSCLLYHKFQQWKRNVLEARRRTNNVENGQTNDSESLPSYTVVSGLPSYDEAIEQLRQSQLKNNIATDDKSAERSNNEHLVPPQSPSAASLTRLSVVDLFQMYKTNNSVVQPTPSGDTKT